MFTLVAFGQCLSGSSSLRQWPLATESAASVGFGERQLHCVQGGSDVHVFQVSQGLYHEPCVTGLSLGDLELDFEGDAIVF